MRPLAWWAGIGGGPNIHMKKLSGNIIPSLANPTELSEGGTYQSSNLHLLTVRTPLRGLEVFLNVNWCAFKGNQLSI